MSLVEFLLARIAEDEAGATERTASFAAADVPAPFREVTMAGGRIYAGTGLGQRDVTDEYHAWTASLPLSARSRRTLAECEAKRQIVARISTNPDGFPWHAAVLAEVYADHPDYNEEWRP